MGVRGSKLLTSQINTASQDATEYLTNNQLETKEGMDVGVQSYILDRGATPEVPKVAVTETPKPAAPAHD